MGVRFWLRLVAMVVPGPRRKGWTEEWEGELASRPHSMADVWGDLPDTWTLRREGWTMDRVLHDVRAAWKGASVLRQVVGQGMALTGVGLAVGVLGARGLSRMLSSLLYGVSATDPVTYLLTACILALVALLASWVPARRAARVNPVEALRSE